MLQSFRRRLTVSVTAFGALATIGVVIAADAGGARAGSTTRPGAPIRCNAPNHRPITVVLVHGAWADPSSWDGEIGQLQQHGCSVRAVANPVQNLTTDSDHVADFLRTIDGPVLLVGHSYGGAVITNAAAQVNNVVGLVYVDAFAPDVREAVSELGGQTSAIATTPASELFEEIPGAPTGTRNLILRQRVFISNFASDLPRAAALRLWASQTVASTGALTTPSRYAAWKTVPSWYFISTGDQIITPEAEMMQAQRAHSHVVTFRGGSHITLISHPTAVTRVIGDAMSTLLASGH
jgi:pimeloyl-ACP methyl ester carboxylesterase